MYIIVAGKPNGDEEFFGPFLTEDRANSYSESLRDGDWNRWFVKPIIVPNCVRISVTPRDWWQP